jgi:hypothetical protein
MQIGALHTIIAAQQAQSAVRPRPAPQPPAAPSTPVPASAKSAEPAAVEGFAPLNFRTLRAPEPTGTENAQPIAPGPQRLPPGARLDIRV